MSNLRSMVDGLGSLQINATTQKQSGEFKVQDEVLVKRPMSLTGPRTSEVMVGRILSMGDKTATVAVQKAGGVSEKRTVNISEVSPITPNFRRSSVQFERAGRGRV